MKLRKTEVRYEMTDESGYNFSVVCKEQFDGYGHSEGWRAVVELKTSNSKTAEDALKHLKYSAEAFLNQIKTL